MSWKIYLLFRNVLGSELQLFLLFFIISYCGIFADATKLRHSRHLGLPQDVNPSLYPQSRQPPQQKLEIFNCPKYDVLVEEEQEIRTKVYQMRAGYKDVTDYEDLIYQIPKSDLPFEPFLINETTGWITTAKSFDRDNPTKEKAFYVVVNVKDTKKKQQVATCPFKVTITDINDNDPMFNRMNYTTSLPKNFPVEKMVTQVFAEDYDEGKNSLVEYSLESNDQDENYFRIDSTTGVVYLTKEIDKDPGGLFRLFVKATDGGKQPRDKKVQLDIPIVESGQKPPSFESFTPSQLDEITVPEDTNPYTELLKFSVATNVDNDDTYTVDLNYGHAKSDDTTQTVQFGAVQKGKDVSIILARQLDYESKTSHQLDIVIINKHSLTAQKSIIIKVQDVNDEIPSFLKINGGGIFENAPAGADVGYMRAVDNDGTWPNNKVTYELLNYQKLFAIDPINGTIKSSVKFDREFKSTYDLSVLAYDGAPSSVLKIEYPNNSTTVVLINILDQNDLPPTFESSMLVARINESSDSNNRVFQVVANDLDEAPQLSYSIVGGNDDGTFIIHNDTGWIMVNKKLDYETTPEYNLTIQVFDGAFYATTRVKINVDNVNDNPPKFENDSYEITFTEEEKSEDCIITVKAHDLDQKGENETITFSIYDVDKQKYIDIDQTGCIKVKNPLDRDPPNGSPTWRIVVAAKDEDPSHSGTAVLSINLNDINDNAPFLNMTNPVVWKENQVVRSNESLKIIDLEAQDYDSPENGPPFTFRIDENTDLNQYFKIENSTLYALKSFDREERKSYDIPIVITDNGKLIRLTNTSILTVIIGDENDNSMNQGFSSIIVYKYKNGSSGINIGRVYVDDPDDWDLEYKMFIMLTNSPYFTVETNGSIIMAPDTINGTYNLEFKVTDEYPHQHTVNAYVNVTVKLIPKEAILQSGSIRFDSMSAEKFIEAPGNSTNRREKLQQVLAELLHIPTDNVDVFTVLHPRNDHKYLDVRFSAHGSPYYAPEKLNTIASTSVGEIEKQVDASILLISINECLIENVHCDESCHNTLEIKPEPYAIYTNISSFVGVEALAVANCHCHFNWAESCLVADTCECPPGLEGSRCESSAIGFHGDGWAIMPPIDLSCENSSLKVEVSPLNDSGLILYQGPMVYNDKQVIRDFISLEVRNGFALFHADFGNYTAKVSQKVNKLTDGKSHSISVSWDKSSVIMVVDDCKLLACTAVVSTKSRETPLSTTHNYINVNYPIQIGGTVSNLEELGFKFNWDEIPTVQGFSGCIRNLEINGKIFNLGKPSYSKNAESGCKTETAAISIGIDTPFVVAILICFAILIMLFLAVGVHRRKTDDLYKDMDDIRENIINYEDEGGGEVDTGYDLNVLRAIYDTPPIDSKIASVGSQGRGSDEVPDICGFLDGKKESCDKDPDTNPYDDVRHYAYEGGGNSDDSLSSLASCTDDGDLKFNYLSNFGPRFRKLADMYGEEASDEESDGVGERENESWC